MVHGVDYDIDQHKETFNKVFCVYWDCEHNVISKPIMWAETLYPVPLTEAVRIFKPEFAAGCTAQFEYVDGNLTNPIIYKF